MHPCTGAAKQYALTPCKAATSAVAALQDELQASETRSTCPLKGVASYSSVRGVGDAVWNYPEPKEAVSPIAGHVGFDTTKGFRVERVG